MKRVTTPEQVAVMTALHAAGFRLCEIASAVGLNHSTVHHHLSGKIKSPAVSPIPNIIATACADALIEAGRQSRLAAAAALRAAAQKLEEAV